MSLPMIAAIALGCAALAHMPMAHWPQLPSPPGAETRHAAKEMTVNGQSLLIGDYDIALPTSKVIAFYRENVPVVWRQSQAEQATLLGSAWQGFFLTIELRAAGDLRTAVRTSLAAPASTLPPSPNNWSPPVDTQVLSRSSSRDGCRTAEVVMLRNRHTLTANSDSMVRAMRGAGYGLESRVPIRGGVLRGELLHLSGQGKQSEIAITDSDGWRWIRVITTVDSE
jgi:hypothetical protein